MRHVVPTLAFFAALSGSWVQAAPPVFAPARTFTTGALSGAVIPGDFNGDGKTDFFAVNFTTASVFLGQGDGNFNPVTAPALSANASIGLAIKLNADNLVDVVVSNFGGSNVFVMIGKGYITGNSIVFELPPPGDGLLTTTW